MPQILSTQTLGVPLWALGKFVFVAHGIVIQSVLQSTEPTTDPWAETPPVKLNDDGLAFTKFYINIIKMQFQNLEKIYPIV